MEEVSSGTQLLLDTGRTESGLAGEAKQGLKYGSVIWR